MSNSTIFSRTRSSKGTYSKENTPAEVNEQGLVYCWLCKDFKEIGEFGVMQYNNHRKQCRNHCKKCRNSQTKRIIEKKIKNGYSDLDDFIASRFAGAKSRAKNDGLVIDFTRDYIKELWVKQNGKCAISGLEMTYVMYEGRTLSNLSIDRIDSTRGYLKNNVQLVCMVINQMKSDLELNDLINICKQIIKHNEQKS